MEKQLYNEFKKHIVQTGLIKPGEKVLLTVSGGIDSVALFHLFLETGTDFAVAHCNFQLRGEEANGDQKFVENLAAAHHIICYTQKFNTKEYASDNKISIQMAARDLRYTWFEEIATENAFQKIATAHNLNDVVETFFLNLTRGTGLKGLSGIKQLKGKLVRPLLFASRNEITEYVKAKNISYREDSSNAETKYMRNAIRHNIVPAFEKLNPSFIRSVLHSSRIIAEAEKVFDKHVGHLKSQLLCTNEGFTYIDVEKLKELNISAELLFELISPYGFSFGNAENIIESLDSQSGISFFSEKYQVLKDRGRFIFKEISKVSQQEFFIQETTEELHQPINLKIKRFGVCPNFV
ncbi:MAG: tRNA lysidine(34) synthetase TilS, partial [Bacteroidales bacterium]|nr:tRNA lysidine(34) synthetase TilS [Bacteroidales bacterium]